MRKDAIEIDFSKLESLLKARGRNLASASEEMGYNRQFLRFRKTRGNTITEPVVLLLKSLYNISLDDIRAEEEPVKVDTEYRVTGIEKEVAEQLHRLIYDAVSTAIKESLKEIL